MYGTCLGTITTLTPILNSRPDTDMPLHNSTPLVQAIQDPNLRTIPLPTTNRPVIRPLITLLILLISIPVTILIIGTRLTTKFTTLEYSSLQTSARRNIRLLVSTKNVKRNGVLKTFSYLRRRPPFPRSSLGRDIMQR